MKAIYCKCRNTYTNDGCGYKSNCDEPEYWRQGIGSLNGDNGESNINNQSEGRQINNERSGLWD